MGIVETYQWLEMTTCPFLSFFGAVLFPRSLLENILHIVIVKKSPVIR